MMVVGGRRCRGVLDADGFTVFTVGDAEIPEIVLGRPVKDGFDVVLNGAVSGAVGPFEVFWEWTPDSAGAVELLWFPMEHTYSSAGVYTIKVRVTAPDDTKWSAFAEVNIEGACDAPGAPPVDVTRFWGQVVDVGGNAVQGAEIIKWGLQGGWDDVCYSDDVGCFYMRAFKEGLEFTCYKDGFFQEEYVFDYVEGVNHFYVWVLSPKGSPPSPPVWYCGASEEGDVECKPGVPGWWSNKWRWRCEAYAGRYMWKRTGAECEFGCVDGVCRDPPAEGSRRCSPDSPKVVQEFQGGVWVDVQFCDDRCRYGSCLEVEPCRFVGRVVEELSLVPLVGVTVKVNGVVVASSDADGLFDCGVGVGNLPVVCSLDGYVSAEWSELFSEGGFVDLSSPPIKLSVESECVDGARRCDPVDSDVAQECVDGGWVGTSCLYGCVDGVCSPEPSCRFRGYVKNTTNAGLDGVKVYAGGVRVATTGSNGYFDVYVEAGAKTVSYERSGYGTVLSHEGFPAGGDVDHREPWITMVEDDVPVGRLEGHVRDSVSHEGIPGAVVMLDWATCISGADGEYFFDNLEGKSYALLCTSPHYVDWGPVTVFGHPGETEVYDIEMVAAEYPWLPAEAADWWYQFEEWVLGNRPGTVYSLFNDLGEEVESNFWIQLATMPGKFLFEVVNTMLDNFVRIFTGKNLQGESEAATEGTYAEALLDIVSLPISVPSKVGRGVIVKGLWPLVRGLPGMTGSRTRHIMMHLRESEQFYSIMKNADNVKAWGAAHSLTNEEARLIMEGSDELISKLFQTKSAEDVAKIYWRLSDTQWARVLARVPDEGLVKVINQIPDERLGRLLVKATKFDLERFLSKADDLSALERVGVDDLVAVLRKADAQYWDEGLSAISDVKAAEVFYRDPDLVMKAFETMQTKIFTSDLLRLSVGSVDEVAVRAGVSVDDAARGIQAVEEGVAELIKSGTGDDVAKVLVEASDEFLGSRGMRIGEEFAKKVPDGASGMDLFSGKMVTLLNAVKAKYGNVAAKIGLGARVYDPMVGGMVHYTKIGPSTLKVVAMNFLHKAIQNPWYLVFLWMASDTPFWAFGVDPQHKRGKAMDLINQIRFDDIDAVRDYIAAGEIEDAILRTELIQGKIEVVYREVLEGGEGSNLYFWNQIWHHMGFAADDVRLALETVCMDVCAVKVDLGMELPEKYCGGVEPPPPPPPESFTAMVVKVVDGDTVNIEYTPAEGDGVVGDAVVEDVIRLVGIDSPEMARCKETAWGGNICYPEEPGAQPSTHWLRALVGGKTISVAVDQDNLRDGYDRILGVISVGEGEDAVNVNMKSLELGWSRYSDFAANKNVDPVSWKALEEAARDALLGIWQYGEGDLHVMSSPSKAEIWISGELRALTEETLHLPPGDYLVTVKLADYLPQSQSVRVTRDEKVELNFPLEGIAEIATLSVASSPSGAKISINGGDTRLMTPETLEFTRDDLGGEYGHVDVRLDKEGYIPLVFRMFLTLGEEKKYETVLGEVAPTVGDMKASSNPSNAEIWVDGVNSGKLTPETLELECNMSHGIKLKGSEGSFTFDEVFVRCGDLVEVYHDFVEDPDVAKVKVMSSPAYATILVDGVEEGYTNKTLKLDPGTYTFEVVKHGFASKVFSDVRLEAGHQKELYHDFTTEPSGLGSLKITSSPSKCLIIFTDPGGETKAYWYTSKTVKDLVPGTYIIEVQGEGFVSASGSVVVEAEVEKEIHFNLESTEVVSGVDVSSSPSHARILIDGVDSGYRSPRRLELVPGSYMISLERSGYISAAPEAVVVVANKFIDFYVELEAEAESGVNVSSSPSNAKIFVDGVDSGFRTSEKLVLSPGSYGIHLELAGYVSSEPVDAVVEEGAFHDFYVRLEEVVGSGLNVTSSPSNAKIFVNGGDSGFRTTHKFAMSPGRYRVGFVLEGYLSREEWVTVEEGKFIDFHLSLTTIGKSGLDIQSNPSHAVIEVKEGGGAWEDSGYRTRHALELSPGEYRVRLSLEGFEVYEGGFVVAEGMFRDVYVKLTPLPDTFGRVRVTSSPSSADIKVDGLSVGRVTSAELELPPGECIIRVSKSGYLSAERTVLVVMDTLIDVHFDLETSEISEGEGAVRVSSSPSNVAVWVDGVDSNKLTPETLTLPCDVSHDIELRSEAGRFMFNDVYVACGETIELYYDFIEKPDIARVKLMSTPSYASILVGGEVVGYTTKTLELTPGLYDFELVKSGFVGHWFRDVLLVAGHQKDLYAALSEEPSGLGSITVMSTPPRCLITLTDPDGAARSDWYTSETIRDLAPGIYQVAVEKEGFISETQSVTVEAEISREISFDLKSTDITSGVNVKSSPSNARIFVDGVDSGFRTTRRLELAPGSYEIHLEFGGYTPSEPEDVVVVADEFIDYFAELVPEPGITGTVSVSSTPTSAKIEVDNVDVHRVTPADLELLSGVRIVKVSKEGYQWKEEAVVVEIGEEFDMHFDLEELEVPETEGRVKVTTNPPNAEIWVDGVNSGKLTAEVLELACRLSYNIELRSAAHGNFVFNNVYVGCGMLIELYHDFVEDPDVAKVRVMSTPTYASILVGGEVVGYTTKVLEMDPGTYDFELRKPGYASQTFAGVVLTAGHQVDLYAELAEEPSGLGSLRITSAPSRALITLTKEGGTPVSDMYTTKRVVGLEPGRYSVLLQKEGYVDGVAEVTVEAEVEKEVYLELGSTELRSGVDIKSAPSNAKILVNGADSGYRSPERIVLEPGTYTIRLELEAYEVFEEEVVVEAERFKDLYARLEPLPATVGTVNVSSSPASADIKVDGVSINRVTSAELKLLPGPHTIEVSKAGYMSAEKVVTVEAGTGVDVHLVLTEYTMPAGKGLLKITSKPTNARVTLGGLGTGKLTPEEFELSPDTYTVEVVKTGYEAESREVAVTEGELVEEYFELVKIKSEEEEEKRKKEEEAETELVYQVPENWPWTIGGGEGLAAGLTGITEPEEKPFGEG